MKNTTLLISAIFFLSTSSLCSAAIYKCKSASGKVEYSDKPCKGDSKPQNSKLSEVQLGPISSLSKKSVKRMLSQLEAATKLKDANKLISFFTPDVEFFLDFPENLGGKQQLGLAEYKQQLEQSWSIPGEHASKLENIKIELSEDKKSAAITATAVESLRIDGKLVMQGRTDEKMKVVIHQNKAKISKLKAKLDPKSLSFGQN